MSEIKKSEPIHFELGYQETVVYYAKVLANAAKDGQDAVDNVKRDLGSTDLFFLMCFILKRTDMFREWLFDRCREVQRDPNDHLDLWAREHYKSTVITFGLTIFDMINNPEQTFAIFSHTKPIAKKFLSQIKTELENNEDFPLLWPDIFFENPRSQAQKWSEDTGIIINRKGNPKEATIEAHGLVDGQPTSRHFGCMIYDDVVTMESVSTPEQISKTTTAWQMSDNLGAVGGQKRYVGTKYHLFDTYRTMEETGEIKMRVHPCTENGKEDGKPVLMDRETLRKKRKLQGPYVFSSQMLLNPTADKAMGFNRDWLVHADVDYEKAMAQLWRFIIVDPAGGKQRKNNDYTTFWVIGHGSDGKFRVLDMVRDRLSLSGRAENLFELHRHWQPHLVAYEEYGMQADIEHMNYVQEQELYEFDITPLGGAMSKELRILRLVPMFENGYEEGGDPKSRIILPNKCIKVDHQNISHDLVRDFIEQEYTAFPVLKHDDMIDGLARIIDLEEMGLIEKPKVVAPKIRGITGYNNLGKTGAGGFLTA